ncbi:MAG: tetratricopeptide (TPR) repeat protein [Cryomorphaceae bacterium]|jgi:tetratricopeptide (TPR) repeat protein
MTTLSMIRIRNGAAGLGLLLFSQLTAAQNVTMFGGSSLAKDCYRFSQTAAMTSTASTTDIEVCTKAIFDGGLNKKDLVATYVNRGIIHMAMEHYQAAARDYNKALGMSDDVGEAYVNRGNLWFVASRFKEAIADYDKSIEFGVEKTHVAFLNRGMAYEQMGKLEEAKSDYQVALEALEDWPAAQKRLQRVQGKIDKGSKTQGAY